MQHFPEIGVALMYIQGTHLMDVNVKMIAVKKENIIPGVKLIRINVLTLTLGGGIIALLQVHTVH